MTEPDPVLVPIPLSAKYEDQGTYEGGCWTISAYRLEISACCPLAENDQLSIERVTLGGAQLAV